jgi:hypothetical protein
MDLIYENAANNWRREKLHPNLFNRLSSSEKGKIKGCSFLGGCIQGGNAMPQSIRPVSFQDDCFHQGRRGAPLTFTGLGPCPARPFKARGTMLHGHYRSDRGLSVRFGRILLSASIPCASTGAASIAAEVTPFGSAPAQGLNARRGIEAIPERWFLRYT